VSLLVLGLLVKRKTKLDFRLGVMPLFTLARSGVLFLFIVTRASETNKKQKFQTVIPRNELNS
jgi:hypothetical protein